MVQYDPKKRCPMVEVEAELDRLLDHGAEQATGIAAPVLDEVKQIVGFVR